MNMETRKERIDRVNFAIAMSRLGSDGPNENDLLLSEEYINGNIDLNTLTERIEANAIERIERSVKEENEGSLLV